jgi:hypothetical protein
MGIFLRYGIWCLVASERLVARRLMRVGGCARGGLKFDMERR